MVGQLRAAGIGRPVGRAIADLGYPDSWAGLWSCERDVLDLFSAIDGNGGDQVVVKEFVLIVSNDHDGIGLCAATSEGRAA